MSDLSATPASAEPSAAAPAAAQTTAGADGARPLAGRVVLITGASSGLGVQMAHAAARAGADVVLAARRRGRLEAVARGVPRAQAVEADVARGDDRRRLVDVALERHGRIDGLINNAGISHTGPALRQTAHDFARVLEVNLVAPFELSCLAATAMRRTGGGSIVNIASVMGVRSVDRFPDAAYVASKAGLLGLTRELASQWGRHGVRVNALAPGFFASEMTQDFLGTPEGPPDWLVGQTPLQRTGQAGELDEPLLFLLGPGSSFVTGQVLVVDGGLATR
jgi:NAD(P)-dependent dehydrogenase (short-subunit alcohol dehydrogenase family)